MLAVNGVGKPCAGEPHARIDGRELETEHATDHGEGEELPDGKPTGHTAPAPTVGRSHRASSRPSNLMMTEAPVTWCAYRSRPRQPLTGSRIRCVNSRRSPRATRSTGCPFARPFDECCGRDSDGSIQIAQAGQLAAGDERMDAGDRQTQPTGRLGQGECGPPLHPRHGCHCARRRPRGPGRLHVQPHEQAWR